jgi:hypothetical protein
LVGVGVLRVAVIAVTGTVGASVDVGGTAVAGVVAVLEGTSVIVAGRVGV